MKKIATNESADLMSTVETPEKNKLEEPKGDRSAIEKRETRKGRDRERGERPLKRRGGRGKQCIELFHIKQVPLRSYSWTVEDTDS